MTMPIKTQLYLALSLGKVILHQKLLRLGNQMSNELFRLGAMPDKFTELLEQYSNNKRSLEQLENRHQNVVRRRDEIFNAYTDISKENGMLKSQIEQLQELENKNYTFEWALKQIELGHKVTHSIIFMEPMFIMGKTIDIKNIYRIPFSEFSFYEVTADNDYFIRLKNMAKLTHGWSIWKEDLNVH